MAMNGLVKNSIFVDFKEWYLLIYCCMHENWNNQVNQLWQVKAIAFAHPGCRIFC